jgi:hypothetical protein
MTKKTSPYACDDKGKLYIRLRSSGIRPPDAYKSGMPVMQFSLKSTQRGTGPEYLEVEDVIEWHERELAGRNKWRGNADICEDVKRTLAAYRAGEQQVKQLITYKAKGPYDV